MTENKRDSIVSWSIESLTRKPLILDPKKQQKFKMNIKRMLNIKQGNNAEMTELEKQFKRDQKANILIKRLQNFKAVISVLKKNKGERSKMEVKALAVFLCERYNFFKKIKDESDNDKMEACVNALNLEIFQKDDKIIRFGEEGRKFYIILDGVVGVYKPRFVEKEMSLKDFVVHLTIIKYHERDEYKLKRTEEANTRTANIQLIKLFNYDCNKLIEINTVKHYFIEEYEILSEKKEGEEFGEVALLQKAPRNATIIAHTECYIASIEKYDYNHIIRKLEEKKFNATINDFRTSYRMLRTWNKALIVKLMGSFAKFSLGYGEILYEQNTKADEIFFTKSGIFEFNTQVSVANYPSFTEYVHSTKGSLVTYLIKHGKFNEDELDTLKTNGEKLNGQFHMHTKSDLDFNFKLQPKKQSLIELKLKEEEMKQGHGVFPVKVRTIEFRDILGIEEALELKTRFYTIKCISQTAEVLKIKLDDFMTLINLPEVDKHTISHFISERKEVLLKQLKNSVEIKIREKNRKIEHQYNKFLLELEEEKEKKEKSKMSSSAGLKIINTEFYKTVDSFSPNIKKDKPQDLKQLAVRPNRNSIDLNLFERFKSEGSNPHTKSDQDVSSESLSTSNANANQNRLSTVSAKNSFIRKLAGSSSGVSQGERKSRLSLLFRNWSIFKELNGAPGEEEGNSPGILARAIRSCGRRFDNEKYRKKIEKKNFEEIKTEISKIIGNNFLTHTRQRNLFAKTFEQKMFSINSVTDMKDKKEKDIVPNMKLTNNKGLSLRLVSAGVDCRDKEDKFITTEENINTNFKVNARMMKNSSQSVKRSEGEITFRVPVIHTKKTKINKSSSPINSKTQTKVPAPTNLFNQQKKSKRGHVSMEITMKYFKNMKQRKKLIQNKENY